LWKINTFCGRLIPFKYQIEFIISTIHDKHLHIGIQRTHEHILEEGWYWFGMQEDVPSKGVNIKQLSKYSFDTDQELTEGSDYYCVLDIVDHFSNFVDHLC